MQPFHTIDVYEMCGEVVLSQGVILSAHCALTQSMRCATKFIQTSISKPKINFKKPKLTIKIKLNYIIKLILYHNFEFEKKLRENEKS